MDMTKSENPRMSAYTTVACSFTVPVYVRGLRLDHGVSVNKPLGRNTPVAGLRGTAVQTLPDAAVFTSHLDVTANRTRAL